MNILRKMGKNGRIRSYQPRRRGGCIVCDELLYHRKVINSLMLSLLFSEKSHAAPLRLAFKKTFTMLRLAKNFLRVRLQQFLSPILFQGISFPRPPKAGS